MYRNTHVCLCTDLQICLHSCICTDLIYEAFLNDNCWSMTTVTYSSKDLHLIPSSLSALVVSTFQARPGVSPVRPNPTVGYRFFRRVTTSFHVYFPAMRKCFEPSATLSSRAVMCASINKRWIYSDVGECWRLFLNSQEALLARMLARILEAWYMFIAVQKSSRPVKSAAASTEISQWWFSISVS